MDGEAEMNGQLEVEGAAEVEADGTWNCTAHGAPIHSSTPEHPSDKKGGEGRTSCSSSGAFVPERAVREMWEMWTCGRLSVCRGGRAVWFWVWVWVWLLEVAIDIVNSECEDWVGLIRVRA